MSRRLTFEITDKDEVDATEITLNGVIDLKLARGDYTEDAPERVLTAADALMAYRAAVRSALPFATVGTLLATVERVAFEADSDDGA